MALIKDSTLKQIEEQIGRKNATLLKFINNYTPTTWLEVQANVRAGLAKKKYAVGDELICEYNYNGAKYEFPWVVLDNDRECTWEDGSTHPGLWLGAKYCTIEDVQFDAPEHEEATEETAQDGLYYCGVNESTYTMLNLAAGATIPYGSYEHVYHGVINHKDAYQYGYNRWRDCGQRQWLNSDGGIGEWWTPTHVGDTAPNQLATLKGFMAGLDSDFLAVTQPVQIKTACNTVTDGGVTDITVDRFFLQSVEEVYGLPQIADVEGPYFPYWKQITGYDNPTNGSGSDTNEARKIRRINNPSGGAAYVRLRSCYRPYVSSAWICYAGGYLYSSYAGTAYAALPACVIS